MKQQKISALMVALLVSAGVMAEDPSLKKSTRVRWPNRRHSYCD